MKRSLCALLVVLSTGLAWAQLPGSQGAPPNALRKPPLSKEARTRYIIRQLDLNEAQQKQAEGLYESFAKSEAPNQDEFLAKVNTLSEEYKKAQAANDKKRMDELSEQLRNMGTNTTEEPQFLENLRAILNDAQKAKLETVLDRLKTNSSGLLRPIDVYRVAVKLGLTADQNAKLEESLTTYREQVLQAQQPRDPASIDLVRNQLVDSLVARIQPILTSEQAAKFEKQIGVMRPDTTPAAPPKPTTGPAKP